MHGLKRKFSDANFRIFRRKTHLFATVNQKKNCLGILVSVNCTNLRIDSKECFKDKLLFYQANEKADISNHYLLHTD